VPATPTSTSGTQLGTTTFGYNTLGEVTSKEDGRGDTTDYTYNGEGQIKKITNQDGSYVCFRYDADGNLLEEHSPSAGADVTYTYNPTGTTSETDDQSSTYNDITDYGYDPVGNVTSIDGPYGDATYDYTSINELSDAVSSWAGEIDFGYVSGRDELLHTVSLPGSITETYGYDNNNRATSYTVTNGSGTNLINDSYNYFTSAGDDSDLMQSSTNTAGVTTAYSYDPLDRLTSANTGTASTSDSYTYNADGEMTSADNGGTTTTYTLNQNNENEADSYDAAGDLTDQTGSYAATYNSAGQTLSITPSGGDEEDFVYLGEDQNNPILIGGTDISYNGAGADGINLTTDLRAPDGQLLAQSTGDDETPDYYLLDPQGSVVGMTNASGSLVDSYSYSPYGAKTVNSQTVDQPYGYDGGYQIPNTNLVQFGARYYDPTQDAWTQLDPSGQDPGYVYAGDDPINLSDPSGDEASTGEAEAVGCVSGYIGGAGLAFLSEEPEDVLTAGIKGCAVEEGIFTAGRLTDPKVEGLLELVSTLKDGGELLGDVGNDLYSAGSSLLSKVGL
jgi:RHS repeat-associated protein